VGKQVQLVAAQTDFRGERDPASARAVRQAFSDSLVGSAAVASAPPIEPAMIASFRVFGSMPERLRGVR
jgi:hypothetical protein